MSGQPSAPGDGVSVSVITISYRGDLELAGILCESIDRYLEGDAEHVLVVPASDLALFQVFAAAKRRIISVESVLPRGYRQLPLPRELRLGRWRRRLREVWWTPVGPVRGWIIQQVVKLSATEYTDADTIVFADSDIELVAPLTLEALVPQGLTRLYRVPGATSESEMHGRWHSVASRLLGVPDVGYTGADFIGNLIAWRRAVLADLQRRLTEENGKRWDLVIARAHRLSEYILYGVFVDRIVGIEQASHRESRHDLVHAGWFYDLSTAEGVERFVSEYSSDKVGIAIQSTENLSLDERRILIARAVGS